MPPAVAFVTQRSAVALQRQLSGPRPKTVSFCGRLALLYLGVTIVATKIRREQVRGPKKKAGCQR